VKLLVAAIVAITSAYAAAAIRYVSINYTVIDEPAAQQLRVVYRNNETRTICLGPENWPSRDGWFHSPTDDSYVEVDGNRYHLRGGDENCPGCAMKVRPGLTIEARLPYASFGLPEALYSWPKTLHFRSVGYICR
jgi:hypothetical protein